MSTGVTGGAARETPASVKTKLRVRSRTALMAAAILLIAGSFFFAA
jgi:hypothetical protein